MKMRKLLERFSAFAFAFALLFAEMTLALGQTDSLQRNFNWGLSSSDSAVAKFGLELGITGPSSVGFKPRSGLKPHGQTRSDFDDDFTLKVRNVGPSTITLCGDEPTFTITAVDFNGRSVGVSSELGPAGNSMGPKIYSDPIAPGSEWSPLAKVPLIVVDETAVSGDYKLKARMDGVICSPDQKHLRGITLYSGTIVATLIRNSP
jgi:hypothetical protein